MKKKEKWERRLPLLASFFIPLLLTIIICIDHEVYPFGEQCILHIDMYHQYCPFFTEFMEKLKSGSSLMYSFSIGLGSDFVSLYAYYLASPLNWLIRFCPENFVIEFMTILVLLKIALCGLTFGYYLREHFKTNHLAISIFATAYALSGFMAAYAWNIMWIDCLVFTPLIVLGLERMVKDGNGMLYYGTLAISILSNYYISIMICIFLVLYFLILWIEEKQNRIQTAVRFFWYSLLAGGTAAVLLIPEIIVLGESGSGNISFPEKTEWYFNILAELSRHCVMTENYTGREHWPNIYSGCFVLLFVLLYFMNRKISWKKKLPRCLLIVLFVISFANNKLDFIWHGMHFPDSLPGRQTFLYTFLLLVISFEAFLYCRENKAWQIILAVFLDFVFLVATWAASENPAVEAYVLTAVFVACYALLLLLYLAGKARVRQWILMLGALTMLTELTIHFDTNGLSTTNRTSYVKDRKDYQKVLSDVEEKETAESEVFFYRTEELERKTKNDAALSGYYSATQFSSLMNLNVSHLYQDLGLEGGKNFYCINGATPLISSMLSIKYVLADNPQEENPIRSLVSSSGSTYLYENKYSLPLGFMMEEAVIDAWDYEEEDPIENQNRLASLLGAEDEMLTILPSLSQAGKSTITVPEDGYIFASYANITTDNLTEEISDGRTKSFTKTSHGYLLDLGYCNAGDEIQIKNAENETVFITAYLLNLSSLDTAYRTLNEQTMELTECTDTDIRGTIDVKKAGRLIFSIAKEDGWTLYVDGKETESEYFAGAFLSVSLEEGTHEIELKYETPGFRIGLLISVCSFAAFLLTIVLTGRKKKHIE